MERSMTIIIDKSVKSENAQSDEAIVQPKIDATKGRNQQAKAVITKNKGPKIKSSRINDHNDSNRPATFVVSSARDGIVNEKTSKTDGDPSLNREQTFSKPETGDNDKRDQVKKSKTIVKKVVTKNTSNPLVDNNVLKKEGAISKKNNLDARGGNDGVLQTTTKTLDVEEQGAKGISILSSKPGVFKGRAVNSKVADKQISLKNDKHNAQVQSTVPQTRVKPTTQATQVPVNQGEARANVTQHLVRCQPEKKAAKVDPKTTKSNVRGHRRTTSLDSGLTPQKTSQNEQIEIDLKKKLILATLNERKTSNVSEKTNARNGKDGRAVTKVTAVDSDPKARKIVDGNNNKKNYKSANSTNVKTEQTVKKQKQKKSVLDDIKEKLSQRITKDSSVHAKITSKELVSKNSNIVGGKKTIIKTRPNRSRSDVYVADTSTSYVNRSQSDLWRMDKFNDSAVDEGDVFKRQDKLRRTPVLENDVVVLEKEETILRRPSLEGTSKRDNDIWSPKSSTMEYNEVFKRRAHVTRTPTEDREVPGSHLKIQPKSTDRLFDTDVPVDKPFKYVDSPKTKSQSREDRLKPLNKDASLVDKSTSHANTTTQSKGFPSVHDRRLVDRIVVGENTTKIKQPYHHVITSDRMNRTAAHDDRIVDIDRDLSIDLSWGNHDDHSKHDSRYKNSRSGVNNLPKDNDSHYHTGDEDGMAAMMITRLPKENDVESTLAIIRNDGRRLDNTVIDNISNGDPNGTNLPNEDSSNKFRNVTGRGTILNNDSALFNAQKSNSFTIQGILTPVASNSTLGNFPFEKAQKVVRKSHPSSESPISVRSDLIGNSTSLFDKRASNGVTRRLQHVFGSAESINVAKTRDKVASNDYALSTSKTSTSLHDDFATNTSSKENKPLAHKIEISHKPVKNASGNTSDISMKTSSRSTEESMLSRVECNSPRMADPQRGVTPDKVKLARNEGALRSRHVKRHKVIISRRPTHGRRSQSQGNAGRPVKFDHSNSSSCPSVTTLSHIDSPV